MEVDGIVTEILEPRRGSGRNGEWVSQDVIIQHVHHAQYPKSMMITYFNCEELLAGITVGVKVKAKFNIELREYQGKRYNNINGWALDVTGVPMSQHTTPVATEPSHAPSMDAQPDNDILPEEEGDTLPF